MTSDWNELWKEPDKPAPTNKWDELLAAKNEKWTLDRWKRPDPAAAATPGVAPGALGPSTKYGLSALNGEAATVAATKEGQRNIQLYQSAANCGELVGGGHLDEGEAAAVLVQAGRQAGLPRSEASATVASGLRKGRLQPRVVPERPGHGRPPVTVVEQPVDDPPPGRTLKLTAASTIAVRPVHWLWDKRIPLGEVTLLGGREGIGKSTAAYTFAADVTRGRLPGKYAGIPKSVIVVATEDSWAHTIAPRLAAAGADLDRVYRVDVTTAEGGDASVSLPHDLPALEAAVREVDAALILLDPLMSRLAASLDTHKDAEVRRALEPLVAVAGRSGASVLGIIHVNKSHSTDPLTLLMGSRAFAAVSRAVLFVAADPDDDELRLLGQAKNNLGRQDLPTLTFRIESAHVADTDEGPVWTSRLCWCGDREGSIRDVLLAADESPESRSAGDDAKDWLHDWLSSKGGSDWSATIKTEGGKAGHKPRRLYTARRELKTTVDREEFGGPTRWVLPTRVPDAQSLRLPGESDLYAINATDATTEGPVVPSVAVVAVVPAPPRERNNWLGNQGPAAEPTLCPACGTPLAGNPPPTCPCPDIHSTTPDQLP